MQYSAFVWILDKQHVIVDIIRDYKKINREHTRSMPSLCQ